MCCMNHEFWGINYEVDNGKTRRTKLQKFDEESINGQLCCDRVTGLYCELVSAEGNMYCGIV